MIDTPFLFVTFSGFSSFYPEYSKVEQAFCSFAYLFNAIANLRPFNRRFSKPNHGPLLPYATGVLTNFGSLGIEYEFGLFASLNTVFGAGLPRDSSPVAA